MNKQVVFVFHNNQIMGSGAVGWKWPMGFEMEINRML